ncbi:hypothetical protein PoB_000227900 [Plakobranchus ocellatus]|uniref:Uncharacterized protein n=1 Tax=Plakobranchus ocellatus TaxID=259542 RepID=A0AAV3Y1C9_9GAST|nr:hypothetical protein PoB_000227900 [Plakobranchus ocellatus]
MFTSKEWLELKFTSKEGLELKFTSKEGLKLEFTSKEGIEAVLMGSGSHCSDGGFRQEQTYNSRLWTSMRFSFAISVTGNLGDMNNNNNNDKSNNIRHQ